MNHSYYKWTPQKDITAWELAQMVPFPYAFNDYISFQIWLDEKRKICPTMERHFLLIHDEESLTTPIVPHPSWTKRLGDWLEKLKI